MKLLSSIIIVSMCLLNAARASVYFQNTTIVDFCKWKTQRTNVVNTLTAQGQANVNILFADLHTALGAAIQPIYKQIWTENTLAINQLKNSDNKTFQSFLNILGYGDINAGLTSLSDLCQFQIAGITLFFALKSANQQTALYLLTKLSRSIEEKYPLIYFIVAQKDKNLVQALKKSETPKNLKILGNIIGYNIFDF